MSKNNTAAQTLEQYRVAFENSASQPQISTTLAEYGYDSETMQVGKALYDVTRQAFDSNKKETDEAIVAFAAFDKKRIQLDELYTAHRKKAKVVFRDDDTTAAKLEVSGIMPKAYIKWIETIRNFYTITIADVEIQTKLARLKVSVADLTAAQSLIPEMESLRAVYLMEKGESQDSTAIKDNAFAKLDDWMREFYAVAKIAMEDSPQLLEALGLTVKR